MSTTLSQPSEVYQITELIHGVAVPDPYRWLEDQNADGTRDWLRKQATIAREYLDNIPGRDRIQTRIRQFLEIETYDSLLITGGIYVYRKRLPHQEQPCIYIREGAEGQEVLLLDPADRDAGPYVAVKPIAVSNDGKILAYEVKEGGQRAGIVELYNMVEKRRLPDALPHGYLRTFAFAHDSLSFYYALDSLDDSLPHPHSLLQHRLGTNVGQDQVVFEAGSGFGTRLSMTVGPNCLLIFVFNVGEKLTTDCYLQPSEPGMAPIRILKDADYLLGPQFVGERLFVWTDRDAPNFRIAELRIRDDGDCDFIDVVAEGSRMIVNWRVIGDQIVLVYADNGGYRFVVRDLCGTIIGEIPVGDGETARLVCANADANELLIEAESFFTSPRIYRYSLSNGAAAKWIEPAISLDQSEYAHRRVVYQSKDGTEVPMFLVGRRDVLAGKNNPAILTSYGGFRSSMTPQFSAFASFLMEKGCVFAIPNIRGGGEFGNDWYEAAKRRNRQTAFDDFIRASEWLIESGIADKKRIGIFGGSNSGLLVGAAMTQSPDLFQAVLFNAPLLDMVRYHLFKGAAKWKDEFGTSEDPEDFAALWSYSPYHRIRDGVAYPAVMMISGDSDQNCDPMHARKTVARLQDATGSKRPVILDYNQYRGHTPVLPLSMRIDALTDRMAFMCDQLGLEA